MRHFRLEATGLDVAPIAAQLAEHPELWNAKTQRTGHDTFAGTSDIWVRFRDARELTEPHHFGEPHFPVFYPAWFALPSMHGLVFDLMNKTRATMLGGILITKIPPGGQVKPHHDRGGWHAEFYDRKVYVPLLSNERCVNHCEEESVVMKPGEAWWFNNLVTHSVVNDGETERVTLIICTRGG
jgi:hypothetical protein